jgi:hypothetical protein
MGDQSPEFGTMISFSLFDINCGDPGLYGSRPCQCKGSAQLHVPGMDEYMTQPIRIAALVEALKPVRPRDAR